MFFLEGHRSFDFVFCIAFPSTGDNQLVLVVVLPVDGADDIPFKVFERLVDPQDIGILVFPVQGLHILYVSIVQFVTDVAMVISDWSIDRDVYILPQKLLEFLSI